MYTFMLNTSSRRQQIQKNVLHICVRVRSTLSIYPPPLIFRDGAPYMSREVHQYSVCTHHLIYAFFTASISSLVKYLYFIMLSNLGRFVLICLTVVVLIPTCFGMTEAVDWVLNRPSAPWPVLTGPKYV